MSAPETGAPSPMLKPEELAERWGINIKTIYKAIKARQLPHVRIGRKVLLIPRAAIEALEHEQGRAVPPGVKNGG
jgi:excisionase family DNA binding protein